MATVVYERIKSLCVKKGITIAKLEADLGFGNSSIKKWEKSSSPSIDKIVKVASYFDVSTDYLLGRSDFEKSIHDIIGDEDIISFQRAKETMPERYQIAKEIIQTGFNFAFSNTDKKDDDSK